MLANQLDDYLLALRANGRSAKTTSGYRDALLGFLRWAEGQGVRELSQIDQRVLNSYVVALQERGLSPASIHTYKRRLNQFLKWLEAAEGLRLKPGKLPRQLRDVLTRPDVERLVSKAGNERDKLLILVMYETGVRVGELVGLRLGDLHDDGHRRYYLRVKGKTGQREVPVVDRELYFRLKRWLKAERPQDAESDHVFLSNIRRPGGGHAPLTASGVRQILSGVAEEANLGKRVHPHGLRHAYFTENLRRGADLYILARAGGNSVTIIDRTYSHLIPDDIFDGLKRLRERSE